MKTLFNDNWFFSRSDDPMAKELTFNPAGFTRVRIPHDWSVDSPFEKEAIAGVRSGYLQTGVGWYRKLFAVTNEMLAGRVEILFDGIFMDSSVYINGKLVGNRPYGYISFFYDITEFLVEGNNLIAIRVDCSKEGQTRWYNGSGIYRNVWFINTKSVYIPTWAATVTTKVNNNIATINYSLKIANKNDEPAAVVASTYIYCQGNVLLNERHNVIVDKETTINLTFDIADPLLWSADDPNLYQLETRLMLNGTDIIDSLKTPFGIRTIEYKSNEGMFINGIHTNLKGVCLHHDGGVVGAAVPDSINRKRIMLLKEMGCNAIRTAHNPFAPEFYEICDEVGMMVMDEIFDGWETSKVPNDYGLYFDQWYERDVTDFITRDKNHPCVVMWSIGNEMLKVNSETTQKLLNLVHKLDPTRKVTAGVNGVGADREKCRMMTDIAGFNDGGGACFIYEQKHLERPDQLFVATEAPHTGQTRGFYRTQTWWRDKNQPRIEIPNLTDEEIFFDGRPGYQSSYDNSGVRVCVRDSWSYVEKMPYLIGEFRWAGIDYYGESEWPKRKSESGVIDTANFPKDHYYLYQSMWRDVTEHPMIHLLPHWTHPEITEGTIIPVWVYTNCDSAELILNDISLGKCEKGTAKHLQWDVPYQPGTITAIAYRNNEKVAQKSYSTAAAPAGFELDSDIIEVDINGINTVQVDVTALDAAGISVPYAENNLYFYLEGDAEFVGTENGDPLDHTLLTSHTRRLFYGLAAATIRPWSEYKLTVAGIMGNRIFKDTTTATIEAIVIDELDDTTTARLKIYYTTNGDEANFNSIVYDGPIEISETTMINAAFYKKNKLLFRLNELFVKGERIPYIDTAHTNKTPVGDIPDGPFDKEAVGVWSYESGIDYEFLPDGTVVLLVDKDNKQLVGHWWYNYPTDMFEIEDYAGTGEIWYLTGAKEKLELTSQKADKLKMGNKSKGIRMPDQEVILTKK